MADSMASGAASASESGLLATGHSPLTTAPATGHSPLTTAQWGMISFLVSEVAFFSTLIIVYLTFSTTDQPGPTPAVLSLPLVIGTTICLLSSSLTIHRADHSDKTGV